MTSRARTLSIVGAAAAALSLAACSPSASITVTASTTPSSPPSSPPSPTATMAPVPVVTTPAPAVTTAAAGSGGGAPARCTSAHLTGSITAGEGSGAGSSFPFLVLSNTGSTTCELHGYPGVSFVGNGNGTQLGAAADFDSSVAATTLNIAPGASVHAPLKIANAQNFDAAACQPSPIDGIRVYPPGETHSIFIASTAYTACVNASTHLLTVQVLQAGAS